MSQVKNKANLLDKLLINNNNINWLNELDEWIMNIEWKELYTYNIFNYVYMYYKRLHLMLSTCHMIAELQQNSKTLLTFPASGISLLFTLKL